MKFFSRFMGAGMLGLGASAVAAQENLSVIGAPVDGALGFQPAATELARDAQWLDGMLLWVCAFIVVFVLALMVYIVVRYNQSSNPTPSKTTHNTPLEVAWTFIPILILIAIGTVSLPTLFKQQEIPEGDIYIKVVGYQWYWGYEYQNEGIGFESIMLEKDELADHGYEPEHYLLATDTSIVVPVGKTIVMNVTAEDVIHSWTIPAFGVKQDAVPGRTAQLWFKPENEGIYFGQCSELCGSKHAYMPITVKVVSQAAYDEWLVGAQEEFALAPLPSVEATTQLAQAN